MDIQYYGLVIVQYSSNPLSVGYYNFNSNNNYSNKFQYNHFILCGLFDDT